jgi:hypothetical protein
MDEIRLIARWKLIGVDLEISTIKNRIHIHKLIIPKKIKRAWDI